MFKRNLKLNSIYVVVPFFICISFFLILPGMSPLDAATKGHIVGTIVDGDNGEPLIGANVFLEGTLMGSACDLKGNYEIRNVPVGTYTLVVSMIGYTKTTITNVVVKADEITKINTSVKPEAIMTEEVVVEAKALKNTEAILLKDRQRAKAVSDAISSEAITRAGSGNAAEAMKQVTGASVVEGKYVYVRGLGDRYTSTQLNGAEIPSTNPYKRAGSIDLIPTNLVDNIVTLKSFTPDKPGNFSGGTVDIKTKDFPEQFNMSFSTGTSYNSQANLKDGGALTASGSDLDWLGMDDGAREIPSILADKDVEIPSVGAARKSREAAYRLEQLTKAFNPQMRPTNSTFPLNQSYSFSIGNQLNVLNRPLGFIASLSYSRSYSSYDNGSLKRWGLGSATATSLVNDFSLNDSKSSSEVLWGGLLKATYKLAPSHLISLNGLYNRNGENTAHYLQGSYPYDLDEKDVFQTSVIHFSERKLASVQLSGEHQFANLLGTRVSWKTSYVDTKQDEPDNRYFTSYYRYDWSGKLVHGIKQNVPPSRYFRYMDENRMEGALDVTVPFKQWSGSHGSVKIGGLFAQKERGYTERLFFYSQSPKYNYNGDPMALFADDNVGVIDSTVYNGNTYYDFGLYLLESITPASTYDADETISAVYAMLDLPLMKKFRFIGGARFETTDLNLVTDDPTKDEGKLKTDDVLPSVNLIYSITENMNLRAAYGRTLARPSFREVAPFATFDFMGGDTYIGNPHLKRTLIDNVDLRWEWFSRPGEIYAVSAFWKNFENPIERVIINVNHEIMWKNVDEARVLGLEFEVRKNLDIISPYLNQFNVGGNLSLVDSRVDISPEEMAMIRATRPEADDTRPLEGQSPFIVNLNLTYDNFERGIVTSLYYNLFGERLSEVSLGGTPDVYEQPAGMLNLTFSWKFMQHLTLNFAGKNLLDSKLKKIHDFKGTNYIYSEYHLGRSFSLGLKYSL